MTGFSGPLSTLGGKRPFADLWQVALGYIRQGKMELGLSLRGISLDIERYAEVINVPNLFKLSIFKYMETFSFRNEWQASKLTFALFTAFKNNSLLPFAITFECFKSTFHCILICFLNEEYFSSVLKKFKECFSFFQGFLISLLLVIVSCFFVSPVFLNSGNFIYILLQSYKVVTVTVMTITVMTVTAMTITV